MGIVSEMCPECYGLVTIGERLKGGQGPSQGDLSVHPCTGPKTLGIIEVASVYSSVYVSFTSVHIVGHEKQPGSRENQD